MSFVDSFGCGWKPRYDVHYRSLDLLNYIAFCDVGDGDFLAISLDQSTKGQVFYLDHDYGFYPHGAEGTEEAYERVSGSIGDWLEMLVETRGLVGTGGRFVPL